MRRIGARQKYDLIKKSIETVALCYSREYNNHTLMIRMIKPDSVCNGHKPQKKQQRLNNVIVSHLNSNESIKP